MSNIMIEHKNPIFLHLDLSSFKTEKCQNSNSHEAKKCTKYHFLTEKRRSQREFFYQKSLCPNKDKCNDDGCVYSHNFVEQIYHSESYKKKYCKDFIEKGVCKYEEFCAMAHSDLELKIVPLHLLPIDKNFLLFLFKSEFCPFSKIAHDRFKCVYAHNWQDYKRPYSIKILPFVCKSWDKSKEIMEYEQGCDKGYDCPCCHGWKELEYHVANFKKTPCKMGNTCDRKDVCSFTHEDDEIESQKHQDEFFIPVAKNIDYKHLPTIEYLSTIEVFVNTNASAYYPIGEGSVNFYKKNYVNNPDHNGIDDDNDFVTKKVEVTDPIRQRYSEKVIVVNHPKPIVPTTSKTFYSDRNIQKPIQYKNSNDDKNTPFNRFAPFQSLNALEQKEKHKKKNQIDEGNEENDMSGSEDM